MKATDYETLLRQTSYGTEDPEAFLGSFFRRENLKEYAIEAGLDRGQLKAIRYMFESRKELLGRAEKALDIDPFCSEAFLVCFIMLPDVYLNDSFRFYFDLASSYGDMDRHEKLNYLRILDLYVDFLMDIGNISRAIKVQQMLIRLNKGGSTVQFDRLAMMYFLLEDESEFYRLYAGNDLSGYSLLLLVLTLLKHDDTFRAKEVLKEFMAKEPCASYLDHLWDIDHDDPAQKAFDDLLLSLSDQIDSIPDFLDWVREVKEEVSMRE